MTNNIIRFLFIRRCHCPLLVSTVAALALGFICRVLGAAVQDGVRDGDIAALKALLKQNPGSIATADSFGMTPLHLAPIIGRKEVAELLLANKVM